MNTKLILSRREFIKAASAAGCLLPLSGVSQLVWGQGAQSASSSSQSTLSTSSRSSSKSPLLVTVFLRGGADGLNLVSPANDLDFIEARPADLRVADAGGRAGFLLNQSTSPNLGATSFYLHPEATGLAELYQAKHLAVIHAVGITDATRSHEEAQSMIERGASSIKQDRNALQIPGWMSRSVANHHSRPGSNAGFIPAYAPSTITPLALEGINNSLIAPDLNAGLNVPWGKPTQEFLRAMSNAAADSSVMNTAMLDALNMQDSINQSIVRDTTGKVLPYQPSGTANYDGAGELARSFSSIARLAKMQVGLQVANIDFGGWDTHENQSGHFSNQVRQLSKGMSAFYEDMQASNQSVTVIVMTEFGRRVRSNKSNGTDHGHGACWFAMGDQIQGGQVLGTWPGLATKQMDQGLDLAVTTDYRQILSDALRVSQLNEPASLPGWSSNTASNGAKDTRVIKPLGLFKS